MRAPIAIPRKRVLVVDDEPDLLELLVLRLDLAGYDPFRAHSGDECLECIGTIRPDALVLDLNMPGTGGFDVLRALKHGRGFPPVPTMVMTARHQAQDVAEAMALGARTYLAKPFEDKQFLRRIAQLVAVRPSPSSEKRTVYF